MAATLVGSLMRRSVRTAINNQLIAQTCDAAKTPGTPGLSAGFIYFCRTYADTSIPATKAYMAIPATVGVAVANAFIGVYDADTGSLLAQTADQSSEFEVAQIVEADLTSTLPAQPINKRLWLAVLIGSYTSTPGFVGKNSFGTNLGMTGDYRLWLSNSGGYNALPATAPAMSKASTSQSIPYISIGP